MKEHSKNSLAARFVDGPANVPSGADTPVIAQLATRGSCRHFARRPVDPLLIDSLCAAALSSPTKSDLQQRDIVLLISPDQRAALSDLVAGQDWVKDAPMIAIFCGNNRRQRQIHDMHGIPFANDHLDAVINAATDAAIALGAFVIAAESVGLGTCPISAVRNQAQAVSDLLQLPDHVFPFAGLAFGWPEAPALVSQRLPLGVTVHQDRFDDSGITKAIKAYDARRQAAQPYAQQRMVDSFGHSDSYGWSEDKARQYSVAERADFGAYLQARGFRLT